MQSVEGLGADWGMYKHYTILYVFAIVKYISGVVQFFFKANKYINHREKNSFFNYGSYSFLKHLPCACALHDYV